MIVLFATERPAGYTDSNGVEVSTFDVIGGGELLVFSGGTVVSGTWLRKAYNRPFEFYDQGGSEMGIPDGRLYMAIAPTGSDVQYRP